MRKRQRAAEEGLEARPGENIHHATFHQSKKMARDQSCREHHTILSWKIVLQKCQKKKSNTFCSGISAYTQKISYLLIQLITVA
jgi:hypothetical protein